MNIKEYTEDVERGVTYPPLKCFNAEDLAVRCGYKEARPCIYAIRGNKQLNHDVALTLQTAIHNKQIELLVNQIDCEEYLINNKDYAKASIEEQIDLKMPYIQTTLTQSELIDLEYESKDGYIRVYEKSGRRKDRYVSLAYGVYFIKEKEVKLRKERNKKSRFLDLW